MQIISQKDIAELVRNRLSRSAFSRPAKVRARYDPQKTWTKDELKVLQKLYQHFGPDWKSINDQLNLIFPSQHRSPSVVKQATQRFGFTLINKSPLSRDEVIFIYTKLKEMVGIQQKHIWRDICAFFPGREVWILQTMMLFIFQAIAKNLVYFFAEKEFKRFYLERFRSLTQLTWMIILYLADHELTIVEVRNPFMIRLCKAASKLEQWVNSFIQHELYNVSDFSDYMKLKADEKMPVISTFEFQETLEVILTLDTLNRVCYCQSPYESTIYQYKSKRKKTRLLQIKRERELMLSCKVHDESDELATIPERQLYVPYDIARLVRNRLSNPNDFQEMKWKEKNFFHLNSTQQKLIQNSEELLIMIPIQTALDQTIVPYRSYRF